MAPVTAGAYRPPLSGPRDSRALGSRAANQPERMPDNGPCRAQGELVRLAAFPDRSVVLALPGTRRFEKWMPEDA